MTLRRSEDWLADYEAARMRTSERKAQSGLLQYEAGRQKRRAAVEDKPTEKESKIQQRGVAMAREYLKLVGVAMKSLYAVPNGGYALPGGTGARLVGEGLVGGHPDLNLDVARGPFHGLRIEVKRPGEDLRDDQKDAFVRLIAEDYKCVICYSAEEIRDVVIDYLGIGISNG